ncbi:DUF1330 domain-containing protein [Mesorhizobium sp. AaZ16]|uniref:DUF1330 domain-containing protein n=1 Tax=Mesorhizobium sp. AaZ16 TaxID=3402289 RepID=UPI00374F7C2B
MPSYIVCTMSIHDPVTYRKYSDFTPPTLARYGGYFATRGEPTKTLEGAEFGERMVILGFPDNESAEAWYNDSEYQRLCEHRRAASKGRMVLQQGSEDSAAPDAKV